MRAAVGTAYKCRSCGREVTKKVGRPYLEIRVVENRFVKELGGVSFVCAVCNLRECGGVRRTSDPESPLGRRLMSNRRR